MLHQFFVTFVGDVILGNGCGQVNAIVKIPAPKDVVVRFKRLPLVIKNS